LLKVLDDQLKDAIGRCAVTPDGRFLVGIKDPDRAFRVFDLSLGEYPVGRIKPWAGIIHFMLISPLELRNITALSESVLRKYSIPFCVLFPAVLPETNTEPVSVAASRLMFALLTFT
jgi:hypothetical protein